MRGVAAAAARRLAGRRKRQSRVGRGSLRGAFAATSALASSRAPAACSVPADAASRRAAAAWPAAGGPKHASGSRGQVSPQHPLLSTNQTTCRRPHPPAAVRGRAGRSFTLPFTPSPTMLQNSLIHKITLIFINQNISKSTETIHRCE